MKYEWTQKTAGTFSLRVPVTRVPVNNKEQLPAQVSISVSLPKTSK